MEEYYTRLANIVRSAQMLVGLPIPLTVNGRIRNNARLAAAQAALSGMLREIAPQIETWAGNPDDPMRHGRPLSKEFDQLARQV